MAVAAAADVVATADVAADADVAAAVAAPLDTPASEAPAADVAADVDVAAAVAAPLDAPASDGPAAAVLAALEPAGSVVVRSFAAGRAAVLGTPPSTSIGDTVAALPPSASVEHAPCAGSRSLGLELGALGLGFG